MDRRVALPAAGLFLLLALGSACQAGEQASPRNPDEYRPQPNAGAGAVVDATKVLVVIEENHTLEQMREGMPYLAQLSTAYGYATHWTAITHPSLPNYLAIAGGTTYGITDDRSPASHVDDIADAPSVFDQAITAGKTARTYAESMPRNCHVYDYPDRADGTPTYAVRHNPWTYFSVGRDDCVNDDVDLKRFADDATSDDLPNVGFIVPDLTHDGHDGSLAAADAWLKQQLAPVLASDDFRTGRLVVVVTADEDDRSADNTILTSVLTPALSGKVVDTPLTHYSLTRYLAQVLGVEPLGEGAHAPDLSAAFGL